MSECDACPHQFFGRCRKAGAHLDGSAHAAVGEFRPSDFAWFCGADRDWRLLCAGGTRPALAARRDRLSGLELVWRQSGWNFGARPAAAEAALWFLRRSHDRFDWGGRDDGRAGALPVYASGDCDWVADHVSFALGAVVSGDLYDWGVSSFHVALWADGTASAAYRRQSRFVSVGLGDPWALPAV